MDTETIDIDKLTYEERRVLLVALLDKSPIKHIPLDDLVPEFAIMSFAADEVPPGKQHTIPVRSFFAWRASRLVLLAEGPGRTAWSLRSFFSGATNVMPHIPGESMPLFPDAEGPPLFEPFDVIPGIEVLIMVSHNLPDPASFRAVLVGKRAEEKASRGRRSRG